MNRGTVLGGIVGGLVASSAVGAGVLAARRRRDDDRYADEPFGRLPVDRTSTVAADDGVPLHVMEIDPADGGTPELTVVLVHGFALSSLCWHFQCRELRNVTEPRVRQVLFDHRGHGRSGRAGADSARISQLSRDLEAVLRTVAPEGPVVLAGHSMGGMVIMELARIHPELFADRVRGVAFVASAAGEVGGHGLPRAGLWRNNPVIRGVGVLADWQPGLVEYARGAGDAVTRGLTRRLAFGSGEVGPSLVRFMTDMLGGTSVAVLTQFLRTLGTHNRYGALAALRHVPVLVLAGDEDHILSFAHSERIAAALPDAELVCAQGAGHMVILEQPDLVNAHLIGLLQRCWSKPRGLGKLRRRFGRSA